MAQELKYIISRKWWCSGDRVEDHHAQTVEMGTAADGYGCIKEGMGAWPPKRGPTIQPATGRVSSGGVPNPCPGPAIAMHMDWEAGKARTQPNLN